MGDMLSIGELAHRTGVSRRMLRHWEEVGLLAPAEVDAWTGHRRYALHQTGRVRAIATLRAVGFGLDAIGDLLADGLSKQRLVDLLRVREAELTQQITDASARRQEVRRRLRSLQEGHDMIMRTLELGPLPRLELLGLQETVSDESEIGEAVGRLLGRLREHGPVGDIVLTYDGTGDPERIVVAAGILNADGRRAQPGLRPVVVDGAPRGAEVRYDEAPSSIGDAWIVLDAALAERALRTAGVYRQVISAKGGVTLQAPVVPLTP